MIFDLSRETKITKKKYGNLPEKISIPLLINDQETRSTLRLMKLVRSAPVSIFCDNNARS